MLLRAGAGLVLLGMATGHAWAQPEPPAVYRVVPAAHCVSAVNMNGLVFLRNDCAQDVRAYWCVELADTAAAALEPAGCKAMAEAVSKATVEIEPGRSASLAVPKRGGNLPVEQVRQVHVAACRLSTRDLNVPHHFDLSYTGNLVLTQCLQKTVVQPGQRTRVVELQLTPDQSAQPVRLLVAPD